MKILVTGAKGFIGKNLVSELKNRGYTQIMEYDKDSSIDLLSQFSKECDFVFHLAGVNRSENELDFIKGNSDFTSKLINLLFLNKKRPTLVSTSSIQAELKTPYGLSKKAGEKVIFDFGVKNDSRVVVYRLTNIFGKWSNPNYNSVVATFSHNISRDIPIIINDPEKQINLIYIDDVINNLLSHLPGEKENTNLNNGFYCVMPEYKITIKELANQLYSFKKTRDNLIVPNMENKFIKKLYSTYLSYIPSSSFAYNLEMKSDNRGSFTEFIKTINAGQVSINVTKPGITKGNHWHHSKNEKFLVVQGKATIKLKHIYNEKIIEFTVSGSKFTVVDIPPGYTHNITNIGNSDLITVIWANENFDIKQPDTFYLSL